jgi:WD40-like Beta Propeller Repeat
VPFLETPFITISPVFSPDGRWVAYRSGEPGKRGIWVQPFPGPGGQWQVSAGPDEMFPIWSRDGHQLFFLADGRIMVADYSVNGDSFVPSKPRVWSEKRLLDLGSPPFLNYDLAPDGKRFAVILYPDGTAEEKPITHVTFLLNFFDELGRRVSPAKN